MVDKFMDEQVLQDVEQMVEEPEIAPKKKAPMTREKKRILFYTLMLIFPMAQFLLFYVYVNFYEISLAFQMHVAKENEAVGYDILLTFDNFKYAYNFIFQAKNIPLVTNSVIYYVLHTAIGTSLALAFSYYIYKKYFMAELFRVVLFLPQIISGMVIALLFKYICEDVYIALSGEKMGLMGNPDYRFTTLIVYNLWLGFGTNILLYTGAMSCINDSIVESAHLDGTNVFTEFFYITFPMVFSTFSTFIITGLSGIFTQQLHLFTFYGTTAPLEVRTLGYYIYTSTLQSGLLREKDYFTYGELSALGLMITLIVLPLTFGVRALLEKIGPSVD